MNHRITECYGLEGTFRGHLAHSPCSEQGYLQPDEVTQRPVQSGLECFQTWHLHYFSGQPVPVFHHPYHINFFLISSLNLPSLSLNTLLLVLSQQSLLKIFSPSFLQVPFRYWMTAKRSPCSLLFSRLNNPKSLGLSWKAPLCTRRCPSCTKKYTGNTAAVFYIKKRKNENDKDTHCFSLFRY